MAGELIDMTERQILYRLVGDVEALKRDTENGAKSRELTRANVEKIEVMLQQMNQKLDKVLFIEEGHEARLKDTENGVADYRKTKTRVVSVLAGVGLGAGGLGGFFGAIFAKMFNT